MGFVITTGIAICFLFVGTQSDQVIRNNNLAKGCVKTSSFIPIPDVQVYYSYYNCNETQNFDNRQRSTVIFIGTPEISGSGYYEYNIFRDVPSIGASLLLQKYDLVFIDMPGIGYSRILNNSYLSRIGETLSSDIVTVIMKILNDYDEIVQKRFYLYSESWGTKILPSVALKLYNNISSEIQRKFQGIFLSSPFVSPISQIISWPDRLLSQGFIDSDGFSKVHKSINKMADKVNNNNNGWKSATRQYKRLEETVIDVTSGINPCDLTEEICLDDFHGRALLKTREMKDLKSFIKCQNNDQYYTKYLITFMNRNKPEGWNYKWNSQERYVIQELGIDLMKDLSSDVQAVLDTANLNVFIISGRNDLISGPSGVHNWLANLNWTDNEFFVGAPYEPFKSSYWKPDVAACYGTAGYAKGYGLLKAFTAFKIGHRIFKETFLIDNTITKVFDLATKKNTEINDYGNHYDYGNDYDTDRTAEIIPDIAIKRIT